MITHLFKHQNDYYIKVANDAIGKHTHNVEVFDSNLEKLEHKLIESFLNPSNTENLVGYGDLYNRSIRIQRAENFEVPREEVYKQNLKTLWKITQVAKEHYEKSTIVHFDQMSRIESSIAQAKKIKSEQENNSGVWNAVTFTTPDPELSQTYHDLEYLYEERTEIFRNIERESAKAICDSMNDFTELAIKEGSFLLLQDMITLVDRGAFFPYLNPDHALQQIDSALNTKAIEFSEDKSNYHEEIESLRKYLSEIKKQPHFYFV